MAVVDVTFVVELPAFSPSSARAFVANQNLVEDVRKDIERRLNSSLNWSFNNVRVDGATVRLEEKEEERYDVAGFGPNRWVVRDNNPEGVYKNKVSSIFIFGPTLDKSLAEATCEFLNQKHEEFTVSSYDQPEVDTDEYADDLPF